MTRDKPICICVGYYQPATGLSRVMETITDHLADRYQFHFIGMGYKGPVVDGHIKIYPCNLEGGDVYGAYQLKQRVEELDPDLIFLLNDLWMFPNYSEVCKGFSKRIHIVAYAAIDGKIMATDAIHDLSFIRTLVCYTEFAETQLRQSFEQFDQNASNWPSLNVIPHGVDTDKFFPLPNRQALKRKWFGQLSDPENAFIVLNANRPHERKRIDLTIQAFAQFAIDKPDDVVLYLHHAVMLEHEKQKIEGWINEAGIQNRVILTSTEKRFISDAEMNEIYNACDLGINTTMGEGWGMVNMEHAATGRAQIVPKHSACEEIWVGVAACLSIDRVYVPAYSYFEMAEVSVLDTVQKLNQLYADHNYRKTIADRCYRHVKQNKYDWTAIAEQWNDLLCSELDPQVCHG